jgi:hypothetical protein
VPTHEHAEEGVSAESADHVTQASAATLLSIEQRTWVVSHKASVPFAEQFGSCLCAGPDNTRMRPFAL